MLGAHSGAVCFQEEVQQVVVLLDGEEGVGHNGQFSALDLNIITKLRTLLPAS